MPLFNPVPPIKSSAIFVDGTNLIMRLRATGIRVRKLSEILNIYANMPHSNLKRIYFYTIPYHYQRAVEFHGAEFFDGIRIIYGTQLPEKDGNHREKGVDALLVADLIYHSASRNIDWAVLVSTDTDFEYAIKRVEDFGCQTALLSFGVEAPDKLKNSVDEYRFISSEMIQQFALPT